MLLDRGYPVYKATERPEPFDVQGANLTAKGESVLAAVAAGEIAPSTGVELLAGLEAMGRIAMNDEITRRIEALEKLALANSEGGET
jgi:hypothetical protein